MSSSRIDLSRYFDDIDNISPVEVRGRVTGIVGLIVKAAVPDVWVGELCLINTPHSTQPIKA
jgi:flagellar biosynthesis/type III secretory pathway ATPase